MAKVELGQRLAYLGRALNGRESRENLDRSVIVALVATPPVLVGFLLFLSNNFVDGTIVGSPSVPALIEITQQNVIGLVREGRERRAQKISSASVST